MAHGDNGAGVAGVRHSNGSTPLTLPLAGIVVLSIGLGDRVNGMLRDAGAVVLVRASAAEMLRVLDAFVPNVIVTEVSAHHDEGVAVIRSLRRLEPHRGGDLPVVGIAGEAVPIPPGLQATVVGTLDTSRLAHTVLGVARRSAVNGAS